MSSEKGLPPDRQPPASAADAASRLATIVDAAERAAASVIDEAEQEARRHLEEAKQQARHHVDEAQGRADRIVAERLRELADELDPSVGGEQIEEERRSSHLKPVETAAEMDGDDDDGGEPIGPRRSGSAGARLLATQMAVSGAGREEIEQHLRSGFEIEDTNEILDAILGPEGE